MINYGVFWGYHHFRKPPYKIHHGSAAGFSGTMTCGHVSRMSWKNRFSKPTCRVCPPEVMEKKWRQTVDGWNPAPVEVGSLSHYLQCFIHPRWCRISAIKSSKPRDSTILKSFGKRCWAGIKIYKLSRTSSNQICDPTMKCFNLKQ